MNRFLAFTYLLLGLFSAALYAADMGSLRNLAKGKRATQSSLYRDGGVASRAVDNNWDSNWAQRSCTHTKTQRNPWWEVDLGEVYTVYAVFLKNREDCCSKRLADISIKVDGQECKFVKQPVENYAMINCNKPLRGRRVRIQLNQSRQYLTLCEVNVLGR